MKKLDVTDYLLKGYKEPEEINFILDVFKSALIEISLSYDKIAIELSGGKDTRFIAVLCKKLKIPVTAITLYYPRVKEIEITRQVVRTLGIPLIEIRLEDYLLQDRLMQYSYLGKNAVFPYEKKYREFDVVLSGYGLTEACRPDKSTSYFYNYIFPVIRLFEKRMNVYPILKSNGIIPALMGYNRSRGTNVIQDMLCKISPEMCKIEYFNSGLPLSKPWDSHIKKIKHYQQAYKKGQENMHIPYDPEYYIRNNIPSDSFYRKVNDLYRAGMININTRTRLLSNIKEFYKCSHNDRRYATRAMYLWETLKESGKL